ncbi:unnamed protein product, partial [Notodromas monacha]
FTLAQEGYDVWLGNFRGSPEASRHKFLNPSEKSFWDFTPDEHGRLDLPALINLVLRASGKDKLVYSGFSMGTHTFFIYCHYHPDACVRNVQAAIMLGPVLDMTFLADSNFLAGAGLLLPSGPYRETVSNDFGFRTQSFDATTDDGYISRLTRIQRKSGVNIHKGKFPILILHGLMSSSLIWTGLGPHSAYAFMLAEKGYDVWLGNFRGSPEASRHTFLNPSEKPFWDFTPDEHGKHDLPALINAVLYHSGKAKLVYSGYSLGTQSFFIYCHYHPEACRKKVQAAIMMAPVMDMSFLTDEKFLAIARFLQPTGAYRKELDAKRVFRFPTPEAISSSLPPDANALLKVFTLHPPALETLAAHGIAPQEVIERVWPGYAIPWALSTYDFYTQLLTTKRFQALDWGPRKNLQRYGSLIPTLYDVKKTNVPVYLVAGSADKTATVLDSEKIRLSLPEAKRLLAVPGFTHTDFVFSDDAPNNKMNKEELQ